METTLGARRSSRAAASHLSILAGVALCALASPIHGQQDSWTELTRMPTPRRLLAAAADKGKIYTFGGCGSPCFDPPLHTSTFEETRVEIYKPDSAGPNPWSLGKPIPAIVFGAAAAAPGNGKIYLFGGFVTGNTVLEYKPADDSPADDSWAAKRPMPTPRHGLAAVALDGKIYVLGGSDGSAASNALEVYDPEEDSWSRKAPMPTARVFLAAAAVNGKIYAIGGSPDCCGESRTDAVEVYDPATDRWDRAAPLRVPLQVSAAAELGGRIYVFGGFIPGSGVQDSTWEYDPDANTWTDRLPMPVKRDQAPAVVLGTTIHVLGGSVNCHCQAIGDHDGYSPGPDLKIDKEIDDPGGVCPGQEVTYTITVTYTGPVAMSATVTDTVPEGLTVTGWTCCADPAHPAAGCTADPAHPAASCTAVQPIPGSRTVEGQVNLPRHLPADAEDKIELTFKLTGTVNGAATGSLENNVEILSSSGLKDEETVTTPILPCLLSITKTDHRDQAAPGDTVRYEITVHNHSPAAVEAEVTDDLAATGLTGTSWCCGVGCDPPTDGNLDDNLDETVLVPANGTVTCIATGTVPCECDRQEISNTACVKAPDQPKICTPPDIDSIVPPPDGDVALVLTGPSAVTDCDSVPYTATVTNEGPGTACGVILQGPASTGFALVSISPPISPPCANGFPCDMPPGSSVAVTATFKVRPGSLCSATEQVTASVESECGGRIDRSLQTLIPCDLSITKTAELTPAGCGDCGNSSILYTIEVANRSCGAVSKARVTDDFPPELEQVKWCRGACLPPTNEDPLVDDPLALPVGGRETYRATGVVPLQFTGTLKNTASVSPPVGSPPDPTPQDDTVTVETPVVPPAGVTVCCTQIFGTPWESGEITKVFVLRNGGPAVQADNPGPEFQDTLPAELTLMSASASSGTIATAANTVSWNGAIGVGEAVTIEITATINPGAEGLILCNQGVAFFDADGDGVNESSCAAQCCFKVIPVQPIPILSGSGLAALVLLLAALALYRMRRAPRRR